MVSDSVPSSELDPASSEESSSRSRWMASSAIGDDGEQFSICEAIMDTKLLEDSPVSGGGGWAMMAFFGAFGASGGATRRSTSWGLLLEWQQFES